MPSFDVVSKVDMHEITNAVDQSAREIDTRFDFKGVNAHFDMEEEGILMRAPSKFQVEQMKAILLIKVAKRNLDLKSLDFQSITESNSEARQLVKVRQGIDIEMARKIVKMIKNTKIKVQAAIQGDQVRVTGKNRDDLQEVIAFLRESDVEVPLQYINFRD